jgi:hypothetical protein
MVRSQDAYPDGGRSPSTKPGEEGEHMLFSVIYHRRSNLTDESTKDLIRRFMAWSPPKGVELRNHYHYAEGGGGIVILETESAAALFEGLTAFDSIIEYDIEPVLNVIEAVAIKLDVTEWVISLGGADNGRSEGR